MRSICAYLVVLFLCLGPCTASVRDLPTSAIVAFASPCLLRAIMIITIASSSSFFMNRHVALGGSRAHAMSLLVTFVGCVLSVFVGATSGRGHADGSERALA